MKDYGADPLGDGRFRMVPSGDIVDFAERMRRLPGRQTALPEGVFGRSWAQIDAMQRSGTRLQDSARKGR